MRKGILFFLLSLTVSIGYSQSTDIVQTKLSELAQSEVALKYLPQILEEIQADPVKYATSMIINNDIMQSVINNGVTEDEQIHHHLRIYFASSDAVLRAQSEIYLLENL